MVDIVKVWIFQAGTIVSFLLDFQAFQSFISHSFFVIDLFVEHILPKLNKN